MKKNLHDEIRECGCFACIVVGQQLPDDWTGDLEDFLREICVDTHVKIRWLIEHGGLDNETMEKFAMHCVRIAIEMRGDTNMAQALESIARRRAGSQCEIIFLPVIDPNVVPRDYLVGVMLLVEAMRLLLTGGHISRIAYCARASLGTGAHAILTRCQFDWLVSAMKTKKNENN